jgi:polyisoprenoid-binding protein YceI
MKAGGRMNPLRNVVLWGLVLGAAAPAQAQRTLVDGQLRQGTLSFDGSATTGDFTGTTTTMTGQMTGGADLGAVRGWVGAPVNTLKTGNGRRDRDLNKSMETAKFPTMRFDLASVTPGVSRGDSAAVTLGGSFTIHGIKRDVTMPATVVFQAGAIHLRSSFPLNLTDYQIGGLSKMLGILKMDPDIVVHVDLLFNQ